MLNTSAFLGKWIRPAQSRNHPAQSTDLLIRPLLLPMYALPTTSDQAKNQQLVSLPEYTVTSKLALEQGAGRSLGDIRRYMPISSNLFDLIQYAQNTTPEAEQGEK